MFFHSLECLSTNIASNKYINLVSIYHVVKGSLCPCVYVLALFPSKLHMRQLLI